MAAHFTLHGWWRTS
ncbi:trp operon leader peptide [Enterobacter ludwigii]